ncbi:hypothetical protein [Clostridium botulinum]|uniref:hypothetical protein n=1 Tax=Clostridium botulinum TaxID=1491 RepID=UPI0006A44B3A|nr:hypothetical protein [Clostridium botulinum]KOC33091.1 hypothetical protein ADU81_10375 [Clostridium botulinum]
MKNNVSVILLICELNSGWCYYDDIVVSYCSDRKIPRGTKCSYALSKLLSNGYKLIDTEAMQSCGQLIYTLSKTKICTPSEPTKPSKPSEPEPEPCYPCKDDDNDGCSIC